jgi:hypothetical protein
LAALTTGTVISRERPEYQWLLRNASCDGRQSPGFDLVNEHWGFLHCRERICRQGRATPRDEKQAFDEKPSLHARILVRF